MKTTKNSSAQVAGPKRGTTRKGYFKRAIALYEYLWHIAQYQLFADAPEEFSGPNAKSAYIEQKDREFDEAQPSFAFMAACEIYAKHYNKEATIIYYNWKKYPGVGRLYRALCRYFGLN